MVVVKKAAFLFLVFSFMCNAPVSAENQTIREEINQLKERIQALEKKVAEQDKYISAQDSKVKIQNEQISGYEVKLSQFEEKLKRVPGETISLAEGLELGAGATMIIQGANNVNYNGDGQSLKKNRTDGSYSADITLSKEFKEVSGKAFVHLENGQGKGLEDNLVLYSNVNRDINDEVNVQVTEAWYEQGLFKDRAVVTFGKLDPTVYFDQSEVANDETTQFLGRIFRNSPTVDFPDNNAGIRLAYLPKEWLELGYGAFNAKSGWEKIGDNLFNIGQVSFKTSFRNLPGNYRFYGWANNANHTKWNDPEKTKETAYGFGLSFDQKASDIVTLFARYGWQNPKVYNPEIKTTAGDFNYSLEQSWSTGFQVEGKPWGREKDVLAFAVGQVFPSGDYKDYYGYSAKPEGHIESYYKFYINNHLSLSPDFQYIWSPFGKDIADDTNPIFIGGMRAQVDF